MSRIYIQFLTILIAIFLPQSGKCDQFNICNIDTSDSTQIIEHHNDDAAIELNDSLKLINARISNLKSEFYDKATESLDFRTTIITILLGIVGLLIAAGTFLISWLAKKNREEVQLEVERTQKFVDEVKRSMARFEEEAKRKLLNIQEKDAEFNRVYNAVTSRVCQLNSIISEKETKLGSDKVTEILDSINKVDAENSIRLFEELQVLLKHDNKQVYDLPKDIIRGVGINYHIVNKYRQSNKLLKIFVEKVTDDYLPYFIIGLNLSNLGEYYESLEYYRKVLRIDEDFSPAINNYGASAIELGKSRKDLEYLKIGEEHMNAVLVKSSKDHVALGNLGEVMIYYSIFKKDKSYLCKALKLIKMAITNAPKNSNHLYNLACIYSLSKEENKMLMALKDSIDEDSTKKNEAINDICFEAYWLNDEFRNIVLTQHNAD